MSGYSKGLKCRWYSHAKPDGTIVKLQGTWELKLAIHWDKLEKEYSAHPHRLLYIADDGKVHRYYPDFLCRENEENVYYDVKNNYLEMLSVAKFNAIRRDNPDIRLIILNEHELKRMGVL